MEIIKGTMDFQLHKETAVAIGKFDGIHRGHRRLLQEILEQKQKGLLACVFTFDPPPSVLFGIGDGKELTTGEEKRCLFEELGIDVLVEFPLTRETAATEPVDFVTEILKKKLRAKFVAAGTDVSFGAKGKGDGALLERMAAQCDYELRLIEKVCENGREISSTYIRGLVEQGQMEEAFDLMGCHYSFKGKVEHGKQIGRTIGFPTVNISPDERKILPPFGVYLAGVCCKGKVYKAITNIGCKPTVTDEKKVGVESFLYDFAEDVYGEEIEVMLYHHKRPEFVFDNLEALKAQIAEDMDWGRRQKLP